MEVAARRIAKAYDAHVVMKYFYDGGHIIAEYDATGALVHKYIYGPGVDQPICMIDVADANATYYYHFDGLGSVIALTDSAGAVANLYEYSIFGEVSASDPNHPNRFLFTGREFDSETGLYYYRARYYNPYIGRFLQTDPVGYRNGVNWYTYCANDAVNLVDPGGLSWEDPALRIAFYDGSEKFDADPNQALFSAVVGHPYWDIAIDISTAGAAAAGYSSADEYRTHLFSADGSGLKAAIAKNIPIDVMTGRPIYDIEHQITVEGLWFFDHCEEFGGDLEKVVTGSSKFVELFTGVGRALDSLGFYGTEIHLRGCWTGEGGTESTAAQAATLSGHAVTGAIGMVHYNWPIMGGYQAQPAPYWCDEGYVIACPYNDWGVASLTVKRYFGPDYTLVTWNGNSYDVASKQGKRQW
jgi:RHS repeat-associated protein